jgi:hypothetical protein
MKVAKILECKLHLQVLEKCICSLWRRASTMMSSTYTRTIKVRFPLL